MSENPSDLLSDTTSAPVLTPSTDREQSRTPNPNPIPPRTRNRKPSGKGNPIRKGQTRPYQKAPLPKSLSTYALFAHYAIYASLQQFAENTTVIYNVLVARDRKLEDIVSRELMTYASLVVAYARMFSVRIREGVAFPSPISKTLIEYASYLYLPEFVAHAIETVGLVVHDDRSYIPWIPVGERKLKRFFQPLISAYSALTQNDVDDIVDALDSQVLLGFQTALVRGLKSGVAFRKVDLEKSAGHESFVVCREACTPMRIRGLTPWVISEPVAQQGALWGWRDPTDIRPSRGMTHTLHYGFATKEYDHQLLLVDLCTASFK